MRDTRPSTGCGKSRLARSTDPFIYQPGDVPDKRSLRGGIAQHSRAQYRAVRWQVPSFLPLQPHKAAESYLLVHTADNR